MASEAEIRKRDIEILKKLSRGVTPKTVMEWVVDNYNLSHDRAKTVVYQLNSDLHKSLKEITDNAAEYISTTLIGEIEACEEDSDRKNKLRAIELLAKTLKVGEVKESTDLNIHFDFGNE